MATTYSSPNYHLVFSTKSRAPTIEEDWIQDLHNYVAGTIRGLGAQNLSVGGVADHVHALVTLKPTHCLADFMRDLKRSSSIWANREKSRVEFAWQEGYAAFTVSGSAVASVQSYIAKQAEHHRKISSRDEILELCREAGIDVDMRYFE